MKQKGKAKAGQESADDASANAGDGAPRGSVAESGLFASPAKKKRESQQLNDARKLLKEHKVLQYGLESAREENRTMYEKAGCEFVTIDSLIGQIIASICYGDGELELKEIPDKYQDFCIALYQGSQALTEEFFEKNKQVLRQDYDAQITRVICQVALDLAPAHNIIIQFDITDLDFEKVRENVKGYTNSEMRAVYRLYNGSGNHGDKKPKNIDFIHFYRGGDLSDMCGYFDSQEWGESVSQKITPLKLIGGARKRKAGDALGNNAAGAGAAGVSSKDGADGKIPATNPRVCSKAVKRNCRF